MGILFYDSTTKAINNCLALVRMARANRNSFQGNWPYFTCYLINMNYMKSPQNWVFGLKTLVWHVNKDTHRASGFLSDICAHRPISHSENKTQESSSGIPFDRFLFELQRLGGKMVSVSFFLSHSLSVLAAVDGFWLKQILLQILHSRQFSTQYGMYREFVFVTNNSHIEA